MPIYKRVITNESSVKCKRCGCKDVWKNGMENDIQYFRCKSCDARFNGMDTYPRGRYPKKTVIKAITFYYNGMSYKAIQESFEDLGLGRPSTSTIWHWVMDNTQAVIPYTKKLRPKVGRSWYADETHIAHKKKDKWLWTTLDKKTRYLMSSNLTETRTTKDATKLFREARQHTGATPTNIKTDSLPAYRKGVKRALGTKRHPDNVTHTTTKGFGHTSNINLIERWHEYVKQRTKVMRDFKNKRSADTVLKGIIINYNFLHEHKTLKGKTPAEAAGIPVKKMGIHNWGDLIEKAQEDKEPKENPSFVWWEDEEKRRRKRKQTD